MKNILKKSALICLSKIGLLDFMHYKNRHKITILMLHGVMVKNENVSWVPLRPQISPLELQSKLELLSNYFKFITIDECINILEGNAPLIENGLLITFDDGYSNTINYALPVCERFGIKPVLFVATAHIDSGMPFWFDRLDYALQHNMGDIIKFEHLNKIYSFDATSREKLKVSYKKFRDSCKINFTDDIAMNELFANLSEMLETRSGKSLHDICNEDDWSGIASWDQLHVAVKNEKLDVASHGVDHWRIDRLPEDQVFLQLKESKMRIEERLQKKCDYFCYPNGAYNHLSISLLKKSGYKAAFSTNIGLCKLKDNLMSLKRFNFPTNKTKHEIFYQLYL